MLFRSCGKVFSRQGDRRAGEQALLATSAGAVVVQLVGRDAVECVAVGAGNKECFVHDRGAGSWVSSPVDGVGGTTFKRSLPGSVAQTTKVLPKLAEIAS